MNTSPLNSLSLLDAKQLQFKLVDIMTKHFEGIEILTRGDLGVVSGLNKPRFTQKTEKVLADFFDAEEAVLVRGAGTAAIRWGLYAVVRCGQQVLVHKAPIYPTTKVTLDSMGLNIITADFNDIQQLVSTLKNNKIDAVLVQHTRQSIDDAYCLKEVITAIKETDAKVPVLTDDNYAALKVPAIGVQYGADLSAFSCFKLLGPEGIGCIVGRKHLIKKIISCNYSGGGQVQGHEALEVLRGLVYAPVALSIQAEVIDEVTKRLNAGEVRGVKKAFIANAQSKVILVEFNSDIAQAVLQQAQKLGAAPYPVGAESKYELVPMFYRVSGTFLMSDASLGDRMIRINPMRAGADTIIRILASAVQTAE